MGIVKWYVVYRLATRGRRHRKADSRARASLPTVNELADGDVDELFELCDECGEVLGDHLVDDDEVLCP